MIKKRYDEYIIDPQVSVSLDQAGSYRYSVVGDVGAPGIKLMTRRLSVTEAVAEAGGVLQTGNRSRVVVLRKQADGTLKALEVHRADQARVRQDLQSDVPAQRLLDSLEDDAHAAPAHLPE